MIPLRLAMHNFMCYGEQTLNLHGIDLACLTGDNGQGKSAILDAMTWALWGCSRLGARRDDELIRLGESEMAIEFDFTLHQGAVTSTKNNHNRIQYRVRRNRSKHKRGQTNLELHAWDSEASKYHPLSGPTIAATQEQISSLLRMDYDTFINSAFLLQGRADEFTIKRPAERKRVLGDILGLQIYERYEAVAKDIVKKRETRSAQIALALEQIDRELDGEDEYQAKVITVESSLTKLQEEHKQTTVNYDQLRAELQEAESAQQRLTDLNRRIKSADAEYARLERELAAYSERLEKFESALSDAETIEQGFAEYQRAVATNESMAFKLIEATTIKEERTSLERSITTARHDLDNSCQAIANDMRQIATSIEQIEEDIAQLSIKEEIAHCPLCGQSLDASTQQDLRTTLETQLARKSTAHQEMKKQYMFVKNRLDNQEYATEEYTALTKLEQQLDKLGYDAEAHRRNQAKLGQLRPYEAHMQTLREARSNLDTIQGAISQIDASQAQIYEHLELDRTTVEGLAETVERIPTLRRQAFEARQLLETVQAREHEASLQLGAARNKIEHCSALKAQREIQIVEEEQVRTEYDIYQDLQAAFSKNGVQAMLIESATPEIEEEANRLLARMTDGRMQVRFETQRDTKQGATVETLDIHITDELGTRSYETYSGGERYRIDFAIRIALSKLLAHRANAQLEMLVIDEGFGSQDATGRDGLIDALNAIRDDFACILVITHIHEIREAFNTRIEVKKIPQGSLITVV